MRLSLQFLPLPAAFAAMACLSAEVFAQVAPPPIVLTRTASGGKFSTTGDAGFLYYAECSVDGIHWIIMPTMKLGNGSPVEWSFAASAPGTPRQFYRIRVSATGNYTQATSQTVDSDGDGIPDWEEANNRTDPWNSDTDDDGLTDFEEAATGLNPRVWDDTSPGIFVLQWQKTDSAFLTPQGWESGYTPAPYPNRYRSITANISESKRIDPPVGEENYLGKKMTIQRVLQPVPLGYEGSGSDRKPVYEEKVTYSHTTGAPFATPLSNQENIAGWATDPLAIASHHKWLGAGGKWYNDYTWITADTATDKHLEGEFGSVLVPVETIGTSRRWTSPKLANGTNDYKEKPDYPVVLPNRMLPRFGAPATGIGTVWSGGATIGTTTQPDGVEGSTITTQWQLANPWTYPQIRQELETLRPILHFEEEYQDYDVSVPGRAWRTQENQSGAAQVVTYQFRFKKIGGGVGPTTVFWPETFDPSDNPDTPGTNEDTGASIVRLRSVALWANTQETPIYKLDPRVSPNTDLSGETEPAATFGSTDVGDSMTVKVLTDHNRDGKLDDDDKRPASFSGQGAYGSTGAFRPKGAIVWANLDYDEERLAAGGNPVADSIRFWHNGLNFESSDEDFIIRNGERTIEPSLPGYTAPGPYEIRSACPDISPILFSGVDNLPAGYRILLRVARAEDVRAFHFYKRIPDFAQGDSEETAIWGAFKKAGAPWSGQSQDVDSRTLDLTKWVNKNAPGFTGWQSTRRAEDDPFVFGVEAMLYK